MPWEPNLIDCFENLFERRDELEKRRREVSESATPSYWIQDEADAYDKARKAFEEKLNEHIDKRIEARLKKEFSKLADRFELEAEKG